LGTICIAIYKSSTKRFHVPYYAHVPLESNWPGSGLYFSGSVFFRITACLAEYVCQT